mgnify:CR=1 FL=1
MIKQHLRAIGELDVVETSLWFPKITRRDFTVALNLTGSGVDDPDLPSQIELDFTNDPDPETAFPACDLWRRLHLLGADQADADNVPGRASETEQQQRATKDAEPLRRIVFL